MDNREAEHLRYQLEFFKICLITAQIAYDRSWSDESKARYQTSIDNYKRQIAEIEEELKDVKNGNILP
jgi:hypothetical protein